MRASLRARRRAAVMLRGVRPGGSPTGPAGPFGACPIDRSGFPCRGRHPPFPTLLSPWGRHPAGPHNPFSRGVGIPAGPPNPLSRGAGILAGPGAAGSRAYGGQGSPSRKRASWKPKAASVGPASLPAPARLEAAPTEMKGLQAGSRGRGRTGARRRRPLRTGSAGKGPAGGSGWCRAGGAHGQGRIGAPRARSAARAAARTRPRPSCAGRSVHR